MLNTALKVLSSLFTLRTLFVLVTLVLLAGPLSSSYLHTANHWLFQVGARLTPKPPVTGQIVQIEVPAREMERLLNDSSGALALSKLLEQLKSTYTKGVLLVVPEVPYVDNYAADFAVRRLGDNPGVSEQIKKAGLWSELKALERRYDGFLAMILDGALVLGVSAGSSDDGSVRYLREAQRLPVQDSARQDYLDWLPGHLSFATPSLAQFRYESKVFAAPLYAPANVMSDYPLLWQVGDDVFADAVVQVLAKQQGMKQLAWLRREAILLGDESLPVSPDGRIYPVYSVATGIAPEIVRLPLSDLNKSGALKSLHEKTVVIGVKDSVAANNAALTLQSLQDKAWYTIPYWYVWVEKGVLLLLAVYLLVLLPLLRVNLGLLVTAFIASAIVVVQAGLQVTQWLWLPSGLLLTYLLAGQLFMLLWQMQRQYVNVLKKESDLYALRLAKSLYKQSDWDEALKVLKRCQPHKPVLDLTYEIAAGMERKRQFQRAAEIYADLARRKRNFRDAAKRAKKLQEAQQQNSNSLEATAVQTMVLNQGSDTKPVLGRYEIDCELGRGAMGIVYLGHDPKISRQVAIKTLSYAQFPPSEIDEVKARFFREAEAAGRLNHPNIVTVYDVGEEPDLAFIAMDYVNGEPLSAYTKPGELLDVEEVYWLVAEVANALGYAHEQNIIHRDIKPSNIMYDPEKQEVKVADFGIARIADNSSTRTGDIIGSPLYMSPEQLKGEKVNGQTDIFSLGVTFYQLLCGQLPFKGDTLASLTYEIIHSKYPSVAEINPDLPASAQRIISKALHKKPDKRFESAYQFAEVLHKQLDKGL